MHRTPEQLLALAVASAREERHVAEATLCAFMGACVASFGPELASLWGETRAGRVSVTTLRQSAQRRARVAEPATAAAGSLAMAFAATAMLHARHALAVLRQPEVTTVGAFRLRVSLAQAYGCASTAAELTPRAWGSPGRVEEALRRALVPCAAA